MRVIAVIDYPRVTEKILRHLGAWHAPPARPPPQGVRGPYTYEPCDDSNSHYGQVSPNPKPEIRNPKEIRDPKADSASSPFNAEAQRFAEVRRE